MKGVTVTLVVLFFATRVYAGDPVISLTSALDNQGAAQMESNGIPFEQYSGKNRKVIDRFPVQSTQLILEELGFVENYTPQNQAVELLGRQFSRAAAQGLVATNGSPNYFLRDAGSGSLDDRANISATTGIDRDTGINPVIAPTSTGTICLSDWDVDVVAWGDPNDSKVLGRLRSAAVAEDGSILSNGAAKLSRYYIVLGFGAEAAALSEYIDNPKEKAVIQALAEIIDSGKSNSPILQGQVYCKGYVAMWAALAQPIPTKRLPSTNTILTTFSGLPINLRSHLGPILSERLRKANLNEEARNALNAVTRAGSYTAESKLMTARLGLTGTSSDQSRSDLEALSHGTDLNAAEALLELLEDAERRETAPKTKWVEEVPSLVRATDGTEVASKLNLAGLRALISIEMFDEFRNRIEENTPGLTFETRQKLSALALAAAHSKTSKEVFIRTEVGLSRLVPPYALSRRDRYSLGERLAIAGLPERATRYLPSGPSTIDEFQITAQILMLNSNYPAAITLLEKAKDDALKSDLGGILYAAGHLDRAISTLTESGESEAATEAALRKGDWSWVSSNGVSEISEAARVVAGGNVLQHESGSTGNATLLLSTQARRIQAEKLISLLESPEKSPLFTN